MNRQPLLPRSLVLAAQAAVAHIDLPRQDAAILMHAGALAQHAVQVGLANDAPYRTVLDQVAALHPGLAMLANLPADPGDDVERLWKEHQVHPQDNDHVLWWSYPLGDLYATLSVEAVKGRALCQTPWWVGELLLHVSLDRAAEVWDRPKVIDPSCGTGHLLLEAYMRVNRGDRLGSIDRLGAGGTRLGAVAALDYVFGSELDPYAATVARYRLLVLAWAQVRNEHWQRTTTGQGWERRSGSLRDLADLPLNVVTADTLLSDGPILAPNQYHVVVANPPYIVCKDKSTSDAIRARYPEVCHRQYSLALPFHAKMMDLLVPGGWCAQITANAFMKREYGTKYVNWLAQFDMQWVIDTSGAYIPGHGTPTVVMVHRNQSPTSDTVRAVMGVRGEPGAPGVPSEGLVWTEIRTAVEARESADRFGRGAEAAWLAAHPLAPSEITQEAPPVLRPIQPSIFDLLEAAA